jgi:hypothetical protein
MIIIKHSTKIIPLEATLQPQFLVSYQNTGYANFQDLYHYSTGGPKMSQIFENMNITHGDIAI